MNRYDIPLPQFAEALERIKPYIRHTPVAPLPVLVNELPSANLRLKLENLQVVGSFKPRGVFNTLLRLTDEQRSRGVITSSGGNHGLAVAYAAARLGVPAIVYLPETACADRVSRVRQWEAEVVQVGRVWDDAHAEAVQRAEADGYFYVHPFDAESILEGQGTIGLEILDDVPEVDCVLVAIGGGGLIAGVSSAIKQSRADVRIIGVEPTGAPTMKRAMEAGHPLMLPEVNTIADTLAPRCVCDRTLALTQRYVEEIVLVSDEDMLLAMQWLWKTYNQLVEPAGAAVIAAMLGGHVDYSMYRQPVGLICGGNAAAEPIWSAYQQQATTISGIASLP